MDLRQLKYFLALVEHGNFARAAEKLGITQSALTQSLARLESNLQVRLFDRGRHGATITDAGTLLLPRAELICAEANLAKSELHEARDLPYARACIGVGKALPPQIVPKAIQNALAKHPDMQITSIEGWTADLFMGLLRGDFDFVVSTPFANSALHPGFSHEVIYEQQEAVMLGTAHPLAQRECVVLADLADAVWLVPPSGWGRKAFIQRQFQEAGLNPPRRFVRTDSSPISSLLVRLGVVVSIGLVEFAARSMPGEYRVLSIPQLVSGRPVLMTYRKRGRLQPAAAHLSEEIRAVCKAEREKAEIR